MFVITVCNQFCMHISFTLFMFCISFYSWPIFCILYSTPTLMYFGSACPAEVIEFVRRVRSRPRTAQNSRNRASDERYSQDRTVLFAKLPKMTNTVSRAKLLFAKPRKQRMLQPVSNCYSRFAKPREVKNVAARGELRFAIFIIII